MLIYCGGSMRVLKFGGSSLATPERIQTVARIVLDEARKEPIVLVVSAFQGITNQLIECAQLAERGNPDVERTYEKIAARHRAAVASLVGIRRGARVLAEVNTLLAELHDALHGIRLLGHCPPQALDITA